MTCAHDCNRQIGKQPHGNGQAYRYRRNLADLPKRTTGYIFSYIAAYQMGINAWSDERRTRVSQRLFLQLLRSSRHESHLS